jgi:hypothetical protein
MPFEVCDDILKAVAVLFEVGNGMQQEDEGAVGVAGKTVRVVGPIRCCTPRLSGEHGVEVGGDVLQGSCRLHTFSLSGRRCSIAANGKQGLAHTLLYVHVLTLNQLVDDCIVQWSQPLHERVRGENGGCTLARWGTVRSGGRRGRVTPRPITPARRGARG